MLDWESLSAGERRAALARPAQASRDDVGAAALEIIADVRARGDEALRAYTRRFDGVELERLAAERGGIRAGRARADARSSARRSSARSPTSSASIAPSSPTP